MQDYKQKIYESWAIKHPDSTPYPTPEEIQKQYRQYRDIISDWLPHDTDQSILDLGCGYGYFLYSCRKSGFTKVTGIDMTAGCSRIAKEVFSIDVVISDIRSYLEHCDTFDVITAFDVLEHLPKEKIPEIFSLVRRKLKPGGRFIFRVPNAESLSGLYILHSDLTHEFALTRMLAKELLQAADFRNVNVSPSFVTSNIFVRLAQKIIAKIFGRDDRFMFSSNLIGIGIIE